MKDKEIINKHKTGGKMGYTFKTFDSNGITYSIDNSDAVTWLVLDRWIPVNNRTKPDSKDLKKARKDKKGWKS